MVLQGSWRRVGCKKRAFSERQGYPSAVSSLALETGSEVVMAFMVMNLQTEDYDAWKPMFDSDPAGRKQTGKGHILSRNADDPNDVFIRVEFDSVADAKTFRERLLASGALDNPQVKVKMGPTVIESAEQVTY
jgi:hypothetical protein